MPTNVLIAAVEAAENILPVAAHEEAETIHNMTAENKLYFQAEKEAIFLILTGYQLASFPLHGECSISSTTSTCLGNVVYLRLVGGVEAGVGGFLRKTVIQIQAERDKDMKKELGTPLAKLLQEASGQFGNQRTMTVAGARKTVGSPVVQQNGIQCFNCKGFGHYARDMAGESQSGVNFLKTTRLKNRNWKHITANGKIQESHLRIRFLLVGDQNAAECVDERAALANLIANLTLMEERQRCCACSYLHSLSDLNANTELQCLYLHKVKECECLAQKLSKQTESVNKEVHNKLLKSFAKLEKHSISLELSLQHCKEQMKNNPVCKENASNVFRKEREQYHEIQDLKAQMQDKNMFDK
ncbi:hypothetical protein Tco_1484863 [Tanacetum coccineum]